MVFTPRGQVCPTVYLLHVRPVCLVPEEWLLQKRVEVTLTLSLSNSSAVVNQKDRECVLLFLNAGNMLQGFDLVKTYMMNGFLILCLLTSTMPFCPKA